MSASLFDPWSRMILTGPGPSQVAEMKIQPALVRVNVKGLLVFEMEETSRSSDTTLFSFFSPSNRIFAWETPAKPQQSAQTKIVARMRPVAAGMLDPTREPPLPDPRSK